MRTKTYVADVVAVDNETEAFKVRRLVDVRTNSQAQDLLDPQIAYADRDALQVVLAGRLRMEFPDIHIDLRENGERG